MRRDFLWLLLSVGLGLSAQAGVRALPHASPIVDLEHAVEVAAELASLPWPGFSEEQWRHHALELEPAAAYTARHELTGRSLLLLLVETGAVAENANQSVEPFFAERDGRIVNVYYHEAARMVQRRTDLLNTLHNPDHMDLVQHHVEQLR